MSAVRIDGDIPRVVVGDGRRPGYQRRAGRDIDEVDRRRNGVAREGDQIARIPRVVRSIVGAVGQVVGVVVEDVVVCVCRRSLCRHVDARRLDAAGVIDRRPEEPTSVGKIAGLKETRHEGAGLAQGRDVDAVDRTRSQGDIQDAALLHHRARAGFACDRLDQIARKVEHEHRVAAGDENVGRVDQDSSEASEGQRDRGCSVSGMRCSSESDGRHEADRDQRDCTNLPSQDQTPRKRSHRPATFGCQTFVLS